MRIVLSGGGTGGHIYPALALREEILKIYPDAEFLYIGTEKGLESRIVREKNIAFESVKIQGLKRSLSLDNVRTLWYFLTSTQQAKKILKTFNPDVVIGTGGYVCAPVLKAAASLGLFTMIHEQNSVAGITNKVLAKYVDKICTCFEDVHEDFKKYAHKIELTGNPRGQELVQSTYDSNVLETFGLQFDKPTVLIFGGSRGALNMNRFFVNHYDRLAQQPYQVLMVTGSVHYDDVKAQLITETSNIKIVPYISNMIDVLHAVELVVCRSGATTLAELTALGVPSVLIPSPHVTNNHQEKNARALVEKGAAEIVLEQELSGDKLYHLINELMQNDSKRENMKQQARLLGITDASTRIITIMTESKK